MVKLWQKLCRSVRPVSIANLDLALRSAMGVLGQPGPERHIVAEGSSDSILPPAMLRALRLAFANSDEKLAVKFSDIR